MNRWNNKNNQRRTRTAQHQRIIHAMPRDMHSNGTPRYYKHNSLFKNVFRCAECGGRITWEVHKGNWYGHCNHYKNCQQRDWVKQENIDIQVIQTISGLNPKGVEATENMLSWVQEALKESHGEEIEFREKATGELNRRYEMVTIRLDKLYDDKIDGKISEDFYQKKFTQYKAEQEEVKNTLDKHQNANLKYFEMGGTILEVAKQAWKIYTNRFDTKNPSDDNMVNDKRLLLSYYFRTPR
jgi:hypothetical protein